MPNWCANRVTVIGVESEVSRFVEVARGCPPQWKRTEWDLRAEQAERAETEARGEEYVPYYAREQELSFHSLVHLGDTTEIDYTHGGYDLESARWGVKWGASAVRRSPIVSRPELDLATVLYAFETPWSPAAPFWVAVSGAWHALRFIQSWSAEGPYGGRHAYSKGVATSFDGVPGPYNFDLKDGADYEAARRAVVRKWEAAHDAWVEEEVCGG